MSGLSLMAGGQARVRATAALGDAAAAGASTPAEAAFGAGASAAAPSRGAILSPNDAFGITLWTGVAAVGVLLLVRHSLPR